MTVRVPDVRRAGHADLIDIVQPQLAEALLHGLFLQLTDIQLVERFAEGEDLRLSLGGQGCGAGAVLYPRRDVVQILTAGRAGEEFHLGQLRHDVGGRAAVFDDPVDPRVRNNVLAHSVRRIEKQPRGVERVAAAPRLTGRVRRSAMPFYADAIQGDELDGCCRFRPHVDHRHKIVAGKDSLVCHFGFGAAVFLIGRADDVDAKGILVPQRLKGQRRQNAAAAAGAVPTGVAQTAQRVILSQKGHALPALRRDPSAEGRLIARERILYLDAVFSKEGDDRRRALVLLKPQLRLTGHPVAEGEGQRREFFDLCTQLFFQIVHLFSPVFRIGRGAPRPEASRTGLPTEGLSYVIRRS